MQTDIAFVEAKIASLLVKLSAAKTDEGKFYYRACIRGWQQTLEKLKAKEATSIARSARFEHGEQPHAEV